MERMEAYDQMRDAVTRLDIATSSMVIHDDDPSTWQRIIDMALDDWLEARDALRRHREV